MILVEIISKDRLAVVKLGGIVLTFTGGVGVIEPGINSIDPLQILALPLF